MTKLHAPRHFRLAGDMPGAHGLAMQSMCGQLVTGGFTPATHRIATEPAQVTCRLCRRSKLWSNWCNYVLRGRTASELPDLKAVAAGFEVTDVFRHPDGINRGMLVVHLGPLTAEEMDVARDVILGGPLAAWVAIAQ